MERTRVEGTDEHGRPFRELRDTGLLWLINSHLHPRGYALALHYDDEAGTGDPTGWSLYATDGDEPLVFADGDATDGYRRVEALLTETRMERLADDAADRGEVAGAARCRNTAGHDQHRWGWQGRTYLCPGRTIEEAGRHACPTPSCEGLEGLLGPSHNRDCRFYLGRRDDAPVIP